MALSPEEIDQRVREAYDTGLLEGTLRTKEANQWSLDKARWGNGIMSFLLVIAIAVAAFAHVS